MACSRCTSSAANRAGVVLVPGDEDFWQEAKALAHHNGRGQARIAGSCPLRCIRPFGHGDHIAKFARLHVREEIGLKLEGRVEDAHGGRGRSSRHEQIFRVQRQAWAKPALTEDGLIVYGLTCCLPLCQGEGRVAQVGMSARGCHRGAVEQRPAIGQGWANVAVETNTPAISPEVAQPRGQFARALMRRRRCRRGQSVPGEGQIPAIFDPGADLGRGHQLSPVVVALGHSR